MVLEEILNNIRNLKIKMSILMPTYFRYCVSENSRSKFCNIFIFGIHLYINNNFNTATFNNFKLRTSNVYSLSRSKLATVAQ
jgi:hypothetical protein